MDGELDEGDESTFKVFADLVEGLVNVEDIYPIDDMVFGFDTQFCIAKDEILDVCHFGSKIGVNCIIAYIRLVFIFMMYVLLSRLLLLC